MINDWKYLRIGPALSCIRRSVSDPPCTRPPSHLPPGSWQTFPSSDGDMSENGSESYSCTCRVTILFWNGNYRIITIWKSETRKLDRWEKCWHIQAPLLSQQTIYPFKMSFVPFSQLSAAVKWIPPFGVINFWSCAGRKFEPPRRSFRNFLNNSTKRRYSFDCRR